MEEYIINGKTFNKDSLQRVADKRGYTFDELLQKNPNIQAKTSPTNQSAFVEPGTALNMESNLGNTSLESQEELSVGEKIINSLKNVSLGIQGFDERLNVGFYTLSRNIFGDEAMDKFVEGKSDFWTQGLKDKDMSEAVVEINRLESLRGETGEIIEGFKEGDAGEVFAGVVNALTSFGESIAINTVTAGIGIYSDFYARAFLNVNEERAKQKGLTVEEFVTSDQYADEVDYNTPLVTGVIAGALERFGLSKVMKSTLNKLPTKGLARLGARLTAGTSEGVTEYGQTLIETVEQSIGQGKSKEKIADDFVNAMFSQEAAESFLQGMVGGTGTTFVGNFNKEEAKAAAIATAGLTIAATAGGDAVLLAGSIPLGNIRLAATRIGGESKQSKVDGLFSEIQRLQQSLKSKLDEKSKARVQEEIDGLIKEIDVITNENNNIVNQTSEKDLKELASIKDPSNQLNEDSADLKQKRADGVITEKQYKEQNALLNKKYNEFNKKINNKVSEISKKNQETSDKNQTLIEIIKDPNASEQNKELAKNQIFAANQGLINKLVNQSFNAELDTSMTKDDLSASINLEFAKLINSYKIEKGAPFGAYVAQNLPRRMPAIFDKLVETKITDQGQKEIIAKQDVTELQIEDTATEIQLDKPKIKKLKTALKLNDDVVSKITDAVRKVLGASLPAVTDKKFKKALTDGFKNELTDLIKRDGVFGKDSKEFANFMKANAEAIYESLPLDVINKSFGAFAEKIIDPRKGTQAREATEAGKGLSRKLPFAEVKDEFIDYFISRKTKSAARSDRKTSIAKQIADQLARDEIVDVLLDPTVSQRFKDVQELQGKEVPKDFLDKIVDVIDRKIEYLNKLAENDTNLYSTLISPKLFTKALATFLAAVRAGLKAGKSIFDAIKSAAEETKPVFKNQTELAEEFAADLVATFKTAKDLENQLKYDKVITKITNKEKVIAKKAVLKFYTDELKANSNNLNYILWWLTNIEPSLRKAGSFQTGKASVASSFKFIKDNKLFDKNILDQIKVITTAKDKTKNGYYYKGTKILIADDFRPAKGFKSGIKGLLRNIDYVNTRADQNKTMVVNTLKDLIERGKEFEAIQLLKVWGGYSDSPLRLAGKIDSYQKNINKGFIYEHVIPIAVIRELMVDVINSSKSLDAKVSDIENILNESKVSLNDFEIDESLKQAMPEGWKLGDDIYIRYGKNKNKLNYFGEIQKEENLSKEINEILEETKGVASTEVVSEASSRVKGKKAERLRLFVPFTAEDFLGLLYQFAGKGKKGDKHLAWIKKNLTDPLSKGLIAFDTANKKANDALKQAKKNIKAAGIDLGKEAVLGYSNDQAIRIHLYGKNKPADFEIEGISQKERGEIDRYVRQNLKIKQYSDSLEQSYPEGVYPDPTPEWLTSTITKDLLNHINTETRSTYLQPFFDNVNEIFGNFDKNKGKLSGENVNKIRSIYGNTFIKALESALFRIHTGRNRSYRLDHQGNIALDWLNDSVGTIMFFNTRSAILQTISAINYTNWTDNNPLKQAEAFANQKQFWNDFTFLFNSDYLKQRRSGLRTDINADEIANAAEGSTNKVRSAISAILKKGFLPTQMADSFAISIGGASFYRNRLNSYKEKGFTQKEAETKAFKEWRELSEEAQQSSRPDKVSMEQASFLGRIILAFQNTPMQYNRLMKKAILDLSNGRGDWKTNLSKIIYYGGVQNALFYAMQQGLFALLFDEEEEEEEKERYSNLVNGMADSILRGSGVFGAIASTTKNTIFKLIDENKKKNPDYTNVIQELSSLSPPLNSKFRKLRSAGRKFTYKQELQKMKELGVDTKNPAVLAGAEVLSALGNLPADRALYKINNLRMAMEDETEFWQAVALSLGWNEWSLGMRNNDKTKPNTFGLKDIELKDIELKDIELKDIN